MALYQHRQPYLYKRNLPDAECNNRLFVVTYAPQPIPVALKAMSGPPDPPKRPSGNRPLHFVNTDAGSVGSRAGGKRSRDIKSHLSGHYRRWKKQQTLAAQVAKTQQQQTGEGSDSSPPTRGESSNTAETSAQRKSLRTRKASSTSTSTTASTPGSATSAARIGESESSSESTSSPDDSVQKPSPWPATRAATIWNALTFGNSDPFNAFPLSVDPRTNMYIQLFHEGTTVMCWSTTADQRLKNLVQHEGLMHSVLAISKVIAATYLPGAQNSPALLKEGRQHYGQLLRIMRSFFTNYSVTDDDLAFEMMYAATMFSFLAHDYDEFEFHLRSTKAFITPRGGLGALKKTDSNRFLNAERLRSLFLLKKPLIAVEEWMPGSWSQEEPFRCHDRIYEEARLGVSSKLRPRLPEGTFSRRVSNLITDHRDMLAAGSTAARLNRSKQPGAEGIISWLGCRSSGLAIRTAEILVDINGVLHDSPPPPPSQPQAFLALHLHAAAAIAANFTCQLVHFSNNPTVGLSYLPLHTLTRYLKAVADDIQRGALTQEDEELYLWTLFVGACAELASRTWSCEPSHRGKTWCSATMARTMNKLGIHTLQHFKDVLRNFILHFLFEGYVKVLFDKRAELMELIE